ncbi:hypothetical protein ACRC6Q_09400 [Planococcus sp. SE5232]|uniref:hypothetical protein n=1 Tax=unclassified Planococcus (in: firmicutes) TaxID=2662419 RepID=UPI003D6AA1D0
MERIEKEFSVVFSAEQSPYFQVNEERRLAISFNQIKGKASFQQAFIRLLFGDESRIDVTFFKSYSSDNSKRFTCFEKKALHQTIRIRNWREDLVLKQDHDDFRLSYATVQDIAPSDVLAYIRSIARGKKPSYIGFYNNRYLLTVDTDEFIVISKDSKDLNDVQNFIREMNGEESRWQKCILA